MRDEALPPVAGAVDLARYPIAPARDGVDPGAGPALPSAARRRRCVPSAGLLDPVGGGDNGGGRPQRVAPLAHRRPPGRGGTPYLAPPDESFPEGHPRRRLQSSSVGAVAYDLIPRGTLIRQLYEWDGLLDFLAFGIGLRAALPLRRSARRAQHRG